MAHAQHLQFVQMAAKHLADDFLNIRILEIGSYNVNGSIRPFFSGGTYVGIDIIAGPDVDVVCPGETFADPDETYDLTLSCECFEHNPKWYETFLNMYRMTKPGGIVLFTCATTGRLEHGTKRTLPTSSPGNQEVGWNYYRNLKQRDFTSRLAFADLFKEYTFLTNAASQDLYFIGRKHGAGHSLRLNMRSLVADYSIAAKALQAELDAQSPYPQALRWISRAAFSPLKVAEWFPDRQYQNIALVYIKAMSTLRRPVQRAYTRILGKR
ncbi:MAG: class I SAM-dependent methyltransferase [Terracidiphilus sp.]